MLALVTGGGGFIGSHVVRALLARGNHVRVLHLRSENLANLKGLDVELFEGDVRDTVAVKRAVSGCELVFHMAAIYALWLRNPQTMRDVNVQGTRNVLSSARDASVKRVVFTSSIAVFGGQGLDVDATEQSPFALGATGDLYSITKYDSHKVALEFAKNGLDVTIVAPTGPIGPGDIAPTPTGRLLIASLNLPIFSALDTISNVADVRDIAAGHLLAAEKGKTGESYLLGNANLSMREMIDLIARVSGRRPRIVRLPRLLLRGGTRMLTLYSSIVSHRAPLLTPAAIKIANLGLRADCRKAVRELDLPQRPVEIAMRDALHWFATNGYVKNAKSLLSRLEQINVT